MVSFNHAYLSNFGSVYFGTKMVSVLINTDFFKDVFVIATQRVKKKCILKCQNTSVADLMG